MDVGAIGSSLAVWSYFMNSLIDSFTIQKTSGVILGYLALDVKGFRKSSRIVYLVLFFGLVFISSVIFPGQESTFYKRVHSVSRTPVLVIGGSSYVGQRVY